MLPECRTECVPFPIPKFSMDENDIDGFMDKLKTFHEQFRDCFSRSDPWENLFRYLSGQFSGLERKSIEPMALQFKYKGVIRSRMVVNKKEKVPVRVDNFAKDLKDYFWYRRTVAEGTKGPIDYEFTKRRVTLCKKGMPDRNVWLTIRRTLGKDPEYSFFISTLSP
jgi:hypothetical protein